MASLDFHFERLCDALEVAAKMEDREEAAEYLRATACTLPRSTRNSMLRLWFLRSSLELLGLEADLETVA